MENPQAGWYPDPSGNTAKLRYWNGVQWTEDYADAQPAYYPQPQTFSSDTDQMLRLIAFILCIVSTLSVCWLIIPLPWMVPMTVHCWGVYQGTKPNTATFGVCTLIFVTIIGGILLLVSKKDA